MKTDSTCFVIMPFSETLHGPPGNQTKISKHEWNHIYDEWIKKAVESFPHYKIRCKRSPAQPGNFIKGIIGDLSESEFVIADLTGGRPNVYYELGIRHALRTGTIIITQHLSALPSDLHGYYAFEYGYSSQAHEYIGAFSEFEHHMHEKLNAFYRAEVSTDSPVSDFLGIRHQILLRSAEQEKRELLSMLEAYDEGVRKNFHLAQAILDQFIAEKPMDIRDWLVVDVYPLELVAARLQTENWQVFEQNVKQLREFVGDQRRLFLSFDRYMQLFFSNPSREFVETFIEFLSLLSEQGKLHEKHFPEMVEELRKVQIRVTLEPTAKGKKKRKN